MKLTGVVKKLRHKKILGMTPGDWIFFVILFVANGIPYLFDALDKIFPGREIPVTWIRALFFIGLLAIGIVYRRQVKSNRIDIEAEIAQLRDERARLAIQQLLELATKSIESKSQVDYRANVMLVKNDKLKICYHYQMDNAPDLGIELEKNQGCAGQAWGSGQQTCADLQQIQQTGSPSWNLPPDIHTLTNHLGAILSTPMFDPSNSQKILGVFNFDSKLSLQKANFRDTEISELATNYANLFSVWVSDLLSINEKD